MSEKYIRTVIKHNKMLMLSLQSLYTLIESKEQSMLNYIVTIRTIRESNLTASQGV